MGGIRDATMVDYRVNAMVNVVTTMNLDVGKVSCIYARHNPNPSRKPDHGYTRLTHRDKNECVYLLLSFSPRFGYGPSENQ
jgi:hypothetical protein